MIKMKVKHDDVLIQIVEICDEKWLKILKFYAIIRIL